MLIRTQILLRKSLNNNINKTNSIISLLLTKTKLSALAPSLIKSLSSKAFSSKEPQGQKLVQSPEELYTTPIYDKENPEFSETYLNLLFNLNSEELNQTNTDFTKVTDSIITLIKLYPSLSNQNAYNAKFDFILNYLYQNPEKFSYLELIKIFHSLIENKIAGCNIPIKLNYYIAAKLHLAKSQILKQKNSSLEDFTHVFFNHFHFCAESGYTSRHILNNFLNILSSKNLHSTNLFANEANVNNIVYLISLAVANINELDKCEITEKAFLEPHKDAISINNMIMVLKLLQTCAANLEVGKINEKTNSRNRLFKALKYLIAEGVQLPRQLDDFLASYDTSEISKFEAHEMRESKTAEKLGNILEKIGLKKIEKDKKFEICAVDFLIEPGVCLKINHEEDFSNDLPKGRVNFVNRYLYLQNYEVINLPSFMFEDESKIEEIFKRRFSHFINEGYNRINAENNANNKI